MNTALNPANVHSAIAIMERVQQRECAFNMGTWRERGASGETEAEFHLCGMAACFGGWVAVSPEFQASGGRVGVTGQPILDGLLGAEAIAHWLGVDCKAGEDICSVSLTNAPRPASEAFDELRLDRIPTVYETPVGGPSFSAFYGMPVKQIRPAHVIEKLKTLLQ